MTDDFDSPSELDEPWRDHRDELLQKVTRRGRALRVRRQTILVTVVTGVLLVPFAAVAATNTQTNVPVLRWASRGADAPAPTTTSTVPVTTTTVRRLTPTTTKATVAPTTIPGAPTTTTVPDPCRNSIDPVCGVFRWDPAPPAENAIAVHVAAAATNGLAVTLLVNANTAGLIHIDFGDGTEPAEGGSGGFAVCKGELHGPWSWPSNPQETPFEHTYAAPGSYVVTVTVSPELNCGQTPYTEGTASATVAVDGTAATTTTSTPPGD